jgi:uncharacterized protein
MYQSKYNFIWTAENGKKIAFNSLTCALAEIEEDFEEILNDIDNISVDSLDDHKKELVRQMLEGGYIVGDDEVDELKLLKFRNLHGKFFNEHLNIVIAPTLQCNFACKYCYENPNTSVMNDDVKQGLIEAVEKFAGEGKSVDIGWYGGEPLLEKDTIYELSEAFIGACREKGASYNFYITTNGFLLDEMVIAKLKEYKINSVQISIDGPPSVHNERRRLKGSPDGSFETVLQNLKKAFQAGLDVFLRINIDKTNIDNIEELLDILKEEGLNELPMGLGQVIDYTKYCKNISGNCMNTKEYARSYLDFYQMLKNKGFKVFKDYDYPGIKNNYCSADFWNSMIVDPEGYVYKCWSEVGQTELATDRIGGDRDEQRMQTNLINWMTWDPFEYKECRECKLLPMCMGGCPFNGRKKNKPVCDRWKFNVKELMNLIYDVEKDRDN